VLPTTSDETDLIASSRALQRGIQSIMTMQAMRGALQLIPEDQQHVLILKFIDGIPSEDMARILSRRESSLPSLIESALRNLSGQMEKTESAQPIPWEVLDDGITRLTTGAATLSECLALHFEYAAQLRPLLQTVLFLKLGRETTSLVEFRVRTREYLLQFMRFNPRHLRRRPIPRLVTQAATFVSVVAVSLLLSGTAQAQSALPGDEFYSWKRTTEVIWRAVSPDTVATDIALANRRMGEWIAVADDPQHSASAKQDYFEALTRFLTVSDPQSYARILPALQTQRTMLDHAGVPAPELDHYMVVVMTSIPEEPVIQTAIAPTLMAYRTYAAPTSTRTRPSPTDPPLIRWPTSTPVPTSTIPPTVTSTASLTPTPTLVPTFTPTDEPTSTPTRVPTFTPTDEPTSTPTRVPTFTPTDEPTSTPTHVPTFTPTDEPTSTPTRVPTFTPTDEPTSTPTRVPTFTPTDEPTSTPMPAPSEVPTEEPMPVSTGQPGPIRLFP
jgi:hypothetical protein